MNSKKIIVIGSCNTDMVIKTNRLPVPGETVIGGTFLMNPGGKGANQAVAAARLGGQVTFISKTGNDVFGKQSIELYNMENINTDYIFSDPKNPSGIALINVDESGENSISVASGANSSLCIEDIESAKEEIESASLLLMQLEIPIETIEYAAQLAHKKGIKVILNPAPARVLPKELLKSLYIITPNSVEAEILSGIKVNSWESAKKAAEIIHAKSVNIVIITMGTMGSLIYENSQFYEVPAMKVKATDTTAAGDTFSGALSVGLAQGMSVLEAVKLATKASAITVTSMGAQSSIPHRSDLIKFG